jgi:hypothetical protein
VDLRRQDGRAVARWRRCARRKRRRSAARGLQLGCWLRAQTPLSARAPSRTPPPPPSRARVASTVRPSYAPKTSSRFEWLRSAPASSGAREMRVTAILAIAVGCASPPPAPITAPPEPAPDDTRSLHVTPTMDAGADAAAPESKPDAWSFDGACSVADPCFTDDPLGRQHTTADPDKKPMRKPTRRPCCSATRLVPAKCWSHSRGTRAALLNPSCSTALSSTGGASMPGAPSCSASGSSRMARTAPRPIAMAAQASREVCAGAQSAQMPLAV